MDDKEWIIDYTCDIPDISHALLLQASLEDLFDIFRELACLLDVSFNEPLISINPKATLKLNVSASKKWCESELDKKAIYVRSDYYESQDFYYVACTKPITYKTLQENQQDDISHALRFFLKYLFGYTDFNPGQEGIIKKSLARNTTLGILPTGSGKSLCYQMACLLQPCISFIVCPIISLIQDQEDNTVKFGIERVGRIESQMDSTDKNATLSALGNARLQFVWISPERFQMESFRAQLEEISKNQSFGYAVIDEVHCLSEWGHDFRVSYLKLHDTIQKYCPSAVILALTATASRNVVNDLLAELNITKQNIQASPNLDRPELHYEIIKTSSNVLENEFDKLLDEINKEFCAKEDIDSVFKPQGEKSICGIIFTNTRTTPRNINPLKGCEGIKSHLSKLNIASDTYHSGRGNDRTQIQQGFINNEFTVMAATKAFGMGINKKNVRYTIHCGLPWSIEAFYQEAGRAGRDKDKNHNYSKCFILYEPDSDPDRREKLFSPNTTIEEIRDIQPALEGDLATLFFLWGGNHEDPDIEARAIIEVFKELNAKQDSKGRAIIPENLVREKVFPTVIEKMRATNAKKAELRINTQDALYKLAILGIVKDWTVDYKARTLSVIISDSISEESVRSSLEQYIKRHTPSFSFENPSPSHQDYTRIYNEAPDGQKLVGLIELLLKWTNDNIIFNRRRSIENMLRLCEAQFDEKSLRSYINNYFSPDAENSDQLDAIVNASDNLDIWIKLFKTYDFTEDALIQKEVIKPLNDIEAIAALCDRYRESFNANIGLEWASLVSRLLAGIFSETDIKEQYAFIAREVNQYPDLDSTRLFDQTVDILANAPAKSRDAFGAAVLEFTPELAAKTQAALEDIVTLSYLLDKINNSLIQTWGRNLAHDK